MLSKIQPVIAINFEVKEIRKLLILLLRLELEVFYIIDVQTALYTMDYVPQRGVWMGACVQVYTCAGVQRPEVDGER